MRINTNTAAMNTYSNLTSANASKSGSLAKLSSGLRINKAGDDAAGLSISEKMKNQISGMTQASRNAQDGISLIQTAEGALTETHSMLNRMRDLTVQAGNGTNTADDKAAIQKEIESLTEEVERVAKDTQFNTKGLLDGIDGATAGSPAQAATTTIGTTAQAEFGTAVVADLITAYANETGADTTGFTTVANVTDAIKDSALDTTTIDSIVSGYNTLDTANGGLNLLDGAVISGDVTHTAAVDAVAESAGESSFTFQIGANAGENIEIDIANMTSEGLGIKGLDVTNTELVTYTDEEGVESELSATDAALKTIDSAIKSVSEERANLGATQNRLEHTVSNLATTKENLSEANSRIRDVDMAEEMMDFTKSNILSQASTAMLAQANQMPQGVLQLLG